MDSYQVIFRGKLLSGFSNEQVAQNLATLFKTDAQRTAAMLAQSKWVIKTGLSKEAAQKYQEALRTAGMMVAVMQDDPVAGSQSPTNPATTALAPSNAQVATSGSASSNADEPLETRAKVPPFNPDLSAYSLAEPGVVLIDQQANKAKPVQINTQNLSLAEAGAVLVTAEKVKPKQIDTSALSVEPLQVEEKPLSSLWLEQA